ncbi:proline-rich receptor-like protein kinase PERK2 [Argentina anserina]|uniref:proline-rich receptor-like protein kinase PERK2 n=1 Tax=Argentina anserina TaxID=57926 RepID=UPI00217654FA|nr:proline-rich receptor-like protein kinase PERK2 [Potentilla anserina]
MASPRPPPPKPLDLDLTIVSAKHLKNVNWKNGDLKPYAVFWVDPDRRLATKSDDSGSTRPVWNERFTLPLSLSLRDSFLTLEIFHCKPSDTPKPLVGSLRLPLGDLLNDPTRIRSFELLRPSGRPQGKIRVKLALRERPPPPDYHTAPPPPSYFYSSTPVPPPPSARDYNNSYSPSPYSSSVPASAPTQSASPPPYHYSSYSDPYYYRYYSSAPPPPMPPRPFLDRPLSYGGPSAPLEYSQYDQKPKSGGKMGLGTGLAVGAVAGALGGLALEERIRYEEDKIAERVENDLEREQIRDDYSNYRGDY